MLITIHALPDVHLQEIATVRDPLFKANQQQAVGRSLRPLRRRPQRRHSRSAEQADTRRSDRACPFWPPLRVSLTRATS